MDLMLSFSGSEAVTFPPARPKTINLLKERCRELDHKKALARIAGECDMVYKMLQVGPARTGDIARSTGLT